MRPKRAPKTSGRPDHRRFRRFCSALVDGVEKEFAGCAVVIVAHWGPFGRSVAYSRQLSSQELVEMLRLGADHIEAVSEPEPPKVVS